MLKSALIGTGIGLACLLPPIIHFITGPLGPLIGGFVAGTKTRATAPQALGTGLSMGLVIAGLATVALSFFLDRDALGFIGGGLFIYVATLGTAGALVGGAVASRAEERAQ